MARRTVFFTIVANNYLAYARVLMDGLLRHHPASPRYVVLCDEPAGDTKLGLTAELVSARDLGIDGFDAMAFFYDVMEFATAIKPACFAHFFARHPGCDVVYLDPDILVTNRLVHVERALADGASIVLTPHITSPLQDGAQPDDLTIMKSGVYNCGFFAAAPVTEAETFIAWWNERCRRDAVVDIEGNRFTDQRWVDLAPSFVEHTRILHNPAYNLAYWNLGHRHVERVGSDLLVAGQPIRFVHFSGVVPADRTVFSKHQTRFTPALIGALRPLFEHYLDLLHAAGWAEFRAIPYAYGRFRNGRPIHPMMRWSFRRHELETAEDPFAGDGAVFDGLEPSLAAQGPPGLTRVLYEIWHRRRDLQRQFDIQRADGRTALLQWFLDEGERSENCDEQSIRAAATSLGRGGGSVGFGPWPPQGREIFTGPRAAIDDWLAAAVPLNPPLDTIHVPVPRHLAQLWEDRPDLQQHFAIRNEAELNSFLAWCLTFGLKEGVVDVHLIEHTIAPFLDQVLIPPHGEDSGTGAGDGDNAGDGVGTADGAAARPADGPGITRMMQMLAASYSGEFPHAMRDYPAAYSGRAAITLWTLTVATLGFGWPLSFIGSPLAWCRARARPFADHGPPITNLLYAVWTLRADVREICNLGTLDGQLRLIAWTIGYGMRELRLPFAAVSDELLAFLADPTDPDVPEFRRFHSLVWASLPHIRGLVNASTPEGKRALARMLAEGRNDGWDFGHWIDRMGLAGALPQPNALALANAPSPTNATARATQPPEDRILVSGLVAKASGRGEDARLTAAALSGQGVACALHDRLGGAITAGESGEAIPAGRRYPVDIVHQNADSAPADYIFRRRAGQEGAYTIGYWAWELASLPAQWHNSFAYYDEIWASTRFAYEAISAAATKPVVLMPMPVHMPETDAALTRASFGLPEDRFLFYFGFDFRSYMARKNPEAVIAAFQAAFRRGEDGVGLVIKTLGGADQPARLAELTARVAADKRIILRDQEYEGVAHATLVARCDCYVSLHRAEGFGRGPAEAMRLGKPVIATAWSGNMDYMTPENALLVDYRLVPVKPGEYPGWESQEWADPDIEEAARHMRAVRSEPALARRLGAAAASTIAAKYDPAVIGRGYLARLRALPVELPFLPPEAATAITRPARRRAVRA